MEFVLGLDLGARSLGWAVIDENVDNPKRLIATGVRIFEAGVDGAIESGREESRAAARRIARLARRQTRRRKQRSRASYHLLVANGLLPSAPHGPGNPEAISIRNELQILDASLRLKFASEPSVQQLPYLLRSLALIQKLEPFELGRALYHLVQRRGFLSNRKAKSGSDEDKDVVNSAIRELRAEMGDQTMGQYFASLNPHECRIRGRYTHRLMYLDEFERIWSAQKAFGADLPEELRAKFRYILSHQRPLKDQSDLIGECELEEGEKRAPLWSQEFQRFRILQDVNHLRYSDPGMRKYELNSTQRATLAAKLETVAELSFVQAKKLLGLPPEMKFSLEEGKAKKFKGNVVAYRVRERLLALWDGLNPEARRDFLESVAATDTNEALAQMLVERYGIEPVAAGEFSEKFSLPDGYASISRKALAKLLPYLEEGLSVQEAKMRAGFQVVKQSPVFDLLPPLKDTKLSTKNPAVNRALTELRKVVNAVVRKYGKPKEIHIEVTRDLKKSREDRAEATRVNRDRENQRAAMRRRIEQEVGLINVSRKDIELGMLWDECGGKCPYTGESLGSFTSLFGGSSRAQVEHIIPRSRSLDDSFENLTLASRDANVLKGNRTPFEAFANVESEWTDVLMRVKSFQGPHAKRKLKRFLMEEADTQKLLESFSQRQLNDTRYATIQAADYLGYLYGGRIVDGRQKIFTFAGGITADLRNVWNLNSVTGGEGKKSRDTHYHHAVDAIVVALCGMRWVQVLSKAAERAWLEKKRKYASVEPPWIGFQDNVREMLASTLISHRPDRRVNGKLHKDFFYTFMGQNDNGGDVVRIRKPVHTLKGNEPGSIVDPVIKKIVLKKIGEVPEVSNLENDPPLLPNRNGLPIPIRRVRIELNKAVKVVGSGYKKRHAEGSETHHVSVYETTGNRGKRVWDSILVPMSEAMRRVQKMIPVIDPTKDSGSGFIFSLCKKDTIQLADPSGDKSGYWIVTSIEADKRIRVSPIWDARPDSSRVSISLAPSALQKLQAQKVQIDLLGSVARES